MASSSASGSRQLQPLNAEQQELIIKQRMQVDERSLRRLVKKLTLLLSAADPESVSSARLSFKADLEAYRLQLLRLSSIAHSTCPIETQSYTDELQEIEQEQAQTQERIYALKRKLEDVRRERKNKLEYDVVAGEIVKLPTREELEGALERLREGLEGVKGEREKYKSMSQGAVERLREVIGGLEGLRNDVGYEVGERERREVERADGDADGETALAGAEGDGALESGRRASKEEPEEGEEAEEGEDVNRSGSSTPRLAGAGLLNPSAPTFRPSTVAAAGEGSGAGRRKRDSSAVAGSDEEGEVGGDAAGSNSNTPRKRQRTTEEGEESEEEEGSIQPTAASVVVTSSESGGRPARGGVKRRR